MNSKTNELVYNIGKYVTNKQIIREKCNCKYIDSTKSHFAVTLEYYDTKEEALNPTTSTKYIKKYCAKYYDYHYINTCEYKMINGRIVDEKTEKYLKKIVPVDGNTYRTYQLSRVSLYYDNNALKTEYYIDACGQVHEVKNYDSKGALDGQQVQLNIKFESEQICKDTKNIDTTKSYVDENNELKIVYFQKHLRKITQTNTTTCQEYKDGILINKKTNTTVSTQIS